MAGRDELVPRMGSGLGLLVPQQRLILLRLLGASHSGSPEVSCGWQVWAGVQGATAASLGFKERGDRLLPAKKSHVRGRGGWRPSISILLSPCVGLWAPDIWFHHSFLPYVISGIVFQLHLC